jgi:hypothetical protein
MDIAFQGVSGQTLLEVSPPGPEQRRQQRGVVDEGWMADGNEGHA